MWSGYRFFRAEYSLGQAVTEPFNSRSAMFRADKINAKIYRCRSERSAVKVSFSVSLVISMSSLASGRFLIKGPLLVLGIRTRVQQGGGQSKRTRGLALLWSGGALIVAAQ